MTAEVVCQSVTPILWIFFIDKNICIAFLYKNVCHCVEEQSQK